MAGDECFEKKRLDIFAAGYTGLAYDPNGRGIHDSGC